MAAGQAQHQTYNRTASTPSVRHYYCSTWFQLKRPNKVNYFQSANSLFCSYLVSKSCAATLKLCGSLLCQSHILSLAHLLWSLIKSCPFFPFHFLWAHLIDYPYLLPPSSLSVKSQYNQRDSGTSLGVTIGKKITSDAHNPNMRDRRRDGEMAIAELL